MKFIKELLFRTQLADIEIEAVNRVIDLADSLSINRDDALNIFIGTLTKAIGKTLNTEE